MFDREPNIDIVFRNGLKDFEVLPPSNIWDNIHPIPVIHPRKRIWYSIAATVTILLTLSMTLSYLVRKPGSSANQLASASNNETTVTINPAPAAASNMNSTTASAQKPFNEGKIAEQIPHEAIVRRMEPSVPSLALKQSDPEVRKSNAKTTETLRENQIAVSQWIKSNNFFDPDKSLTATAKPKDKISKFMLGASFSPAMSIVNSGDDPQIKEMLNNENPLPTYSAGISVAYKVSSRFSIQAGVGLASRGQLIENVDVYTGLSRFYSSKGPYNYVVETASGTLYANNPDIYLADAASNRVITFIPEGDVDPSKLKLSHVNSDIKQLFRYLEIPVLARYKIIDRKIDMNISGGLSYGFLVENVSYAVGDKELIKIGYTQGINKYSISSQVGVGMEYNINKVVTFNVEPVFRYYMTPLSDLSGVVTSPYSFGVFSGFFFRF